MRFLSSVLFVSISLLASIGLVSAEPASSGAATLLPRQIGDFRQVGAVHPGAQLYRDGVTDPGNVLPDGRSKSESVSAEAEYLSGDSTRFKIEVVRFSQDADAYSLLTFVATTVSVADRRITKDIGTASLVSPTGINFFKGPVFVRVTQTGAAKPSDQIQKLAQLFADGLEKGEGDVPVLVKHLPDWEKAQEQAIYFARFKSLKAALSNQPVLDAVSSDGDADAVIGNYDGAQLLLIEFNTPQLAGDNDRSIIARIQELRDQGQPLPSAYRKIGNYSVFVFNASTEQAANQLVDQVKYEQVVQWLGDNPNILERAQRAYYQTTAGVLIAVLKASGLSLIACLAVGGFLGALLFSRRRAQQRAAEAYSDAGGMLRLNIDEMTPETDPGKLLGPAK